MGASGLLFSASRNLTRVRNSSSCRLSSSGDSVSGPWVPFWVSGEEPPKFRAPSVFHEEIDFFDYLDINIWVFKFSIVNIIVNVYNQRLNLSIA